MIDIDTWWYLLIFVDINYFQIFAHVVHRESGLATSLTQCKQALFQLDHPSDSNLQFLHVDIVQGLQRHLQVIYQDLDTWRTDLEDVWRQAEARLTTLIQLQKHLERSREVGHCSNIFLDFVIFIDMIKLQDKAQIFIMAKMCKSEKKTKRW